MLEFRDKTRTDELLKQIQDINPNKKIKIMNVCGTHEMTIAKWGLRKLLPKNIKLICGPGCPVCVTSSYEIDLAIEISKQPNTTVLAFGDMFRVPGSKISLSQAKSQGSDVRVIYGVDEVIKLAKQTKNKVIFFSAGFETTTPAIASELLNNKDLNNLFIITSNRLIPPAIESLLSSQNITIDGFICPGHVSTIIGSNAYKQLSEIYKRPMVVSGFEPKDVLEAVLMILKQTNSNQAKTENQYSRVVKPEGNTVAQNIMYDVFEICDKEWRGIGIIPKSGLKLKKEFEKFDAEKNFNIQIQTQEVKTACKCGEIMKGNALPQDCPLFAKACTPNTPIGACIVSYEGPCYIAYNYE
jgi:hydrogenase expression/formation protein HypD